MKKELDYTEGYRLAIDNAQELLAIAEMAKAVCYGKASALLVLASEEALKAGMLMSHNFTSDSIDGDFDQYFKNHKFKHNSMRDINKVGTLFSKMSETLINPAKTLANGKPGTLTHEELMKAKEQGEDDLENFLTLLEGEEDIENTNLLPDNNKDWWNNADTLKKRGFYLGLNKGSKEWESPGQISEEQFNKSYAIVKEFIDVISTAEDRVKDPFFRMAFERFKKE